MAAMPAFARWDIFCRIVDNYGDAGVCWRLARQLATEHALDVTLWQDDLAPLARIARGVDRECPEQRVMDVTIRSWDEPFAATEAADAVVEAFGCGLPESYVDAMVRRSIAPAWFVLEYLSAEAWIERAQGLPSPHPRLPLSRRFWFPGFTSRTGGLLRERDLFDSRDRFLADRDAQDAFWASLQLPPTARDEVRVSLFCYPNPAVVALFGAWAAGDAPVSCIVPEGVAAAALDVWSGGNAPRPGAPLTRGRLTLYAIPFLAQDDYDRLLWLCRVNFVRGEDSFVRAQWAAHPFVWHAYPQAENAHWNKVDAFMDSYVAALDVASAASVRGLWRAWNGAADAPAIAEAWRKFATANAKLERHAAEWSLKLARLPSLAAGLVEAAAGQV